MDRQNLGSLVGGIAGGALGTAAMKAQQKLVGKLPEAVRPPPMSGDPGDYMVSKLEQRSHREVAPSTHRRAAAGMHWAYGIGWSTLLAAFGPRLGMHRLGRATMLGALLGAGVWAVGYLGWLPKTGLVAPVREQGAGHVAGSLATHVVYGVVAALPIYAANRLS